MNKEQDLQPLESPGHRTILEPLIKVILCLVFLIYVTVLVMEVVTLINWQKNTESYFGDINNTLKPENLAFVEAKIFEDYYTESGIWESENYISRCVVSNDSEKFDCHPEQGGNEESCRKRGCCWETNNVPRVPWCYYPKNYGGYESVNVTSSKSGIRVFLSRSFPSPYPEDVKLVRADIYYESKNRIHVKILDAESNRYEPPFPEIPILIDNDLEHTNYRSTFNSNGFKIYSGEDIVFDNEGVGALIFANQFLQISIKVFGSIYGLGEHQTSLQLDTNWTRFTLFNRDGIPEPEANLYGSHPFFLVMGPDGKSQGLFFHNSNAMDVLLQPLPALTFRSIGGIFDFYIFLGPTPADIIKQYTEVIGRTFLPPYWSLGFHLSRFGHKNTSDMRKVWKRTRAAEIPFDTQWSDIDYMERRNDFTVDRKNYGDLAKFVREIHEAGMHYVPIVDPGISGCEPPGTYPPYDEGMAMDVFVKNADGGVFVGKVWNPNCTVFPDFTAFATHVYWLIQMKRFHDLVPFDGIWIDMNEPSNFLSGSFNGCPPTKWDNPPYTPNVVGGKLSHLTLCMSARHAAGLHYDVHNVYGLGEAIATNRALKLLGKRPFVISRSSYPGIGRYAGHWSGDVTATWDSMKASIPKMLSFSLFGVPMMGADICGFNGNTTALLCQRWSQLGAFYPFSRNHNSDDCIDQDPVALGADVVKSARKALLVRYTLLPYLYTLFFKAHTEGETVARPLFFEFWWDPRTHNLDESFLWGCCVLIVPVLKEYATTVETYLPAARWYNWYTGLGLESNGTKVVLPASSDTIPVFIRGGVILPTQAPNVTTTLSRMNLIELIVASNVSLTASGSLYWDNGESLNTLKTGKYGEITFTLTPNNLTSHVKFWGYHKVPTLGSIKILGFVKPIKKIYFNKKAVEFKWSSTSLILTVEVLHTINVPFELEWNEFEL